MEVDGSVAPAVHYPDLGGEVAVGDAVVLNATALELGLGTGGVHLVIAIEGRASTDASVPGRVIKARYTPVQTAVASVEESHAADLEASAGLRQMPVVCAPLHSMLAPIAAGVKRTAPDLRIAYVMTDGAALPGGFSRLVAALRRRAPRRLGHVWAGVRRGSSRPSRSGADFWRPPSCWRRTSPWSPTGPATSGPRPPGGERARERARADGGGHARRPADPRAAGEFRGCEVASPKVCPTTRSRSWPTSARST